MCTKNPILFLLLVSFFLLSGIENAFSQAGSTTITFLQTKQVYAENDHDDFPTGSNEYRWKIWLNGTLVANCIQKSGGPGWYDEVFSLGTNIYVPNVTTNSMELRGEAWEEDGCDGNCSYNTCTLNDDDGHCGPNNNYFSIYNYPPGMTNEIVLWPCTSGQPYAIRYQFAYNVPQPQTPGVSAPSGQICDHPTIELSSNSFINNSYLSNTQFVWEYRVGSTWRYLTTTNANSNNGRFSFWYIRYLTGLTNITVNTDVYFRVKTRYTATTGGVYESAYSNVSSAVHLSPLPPSISSTSTTPSCPGQSTGTITVNVNGLGEYLYVLRVGENPGTCNPETGNCGGTKSGRVYSNTFTISNVAAGRYTLIVANRGGTGGVCWNYVYIDVGQIPVLQLQSPTLTPVSCHGDSDGAITINSSGGIAPRYYSLTKSGFSGFNTTGVFTGLTAGTYTSSVTDGCFQLTTASVTVYEPSLILANVNYNSPFCNSPADGSVQVEITQGDGLYSFKLLKDSELVDELENAKLNSWMVNNLEGGNYTVEIKDAAHLQCEGFTSSSSLVEAPSFQINANDIIKENISCYGRTDGDIQINNADDSGTFQYILTNISNGQSTVLTTPAFSGLEASSYALAMQRNISGCNDRFDLPSPIELTQPEQIIITFDQHDITCYGANDGSLVATVQGSTNSDQYTWEKSINGSWSTLSNTTTMLQNLEAGMYRMRVANGGGCSAQSPEAIFIEPVLLSIALVNVHDIKCLGEQGNIETIINGGTQPYQYHYSATGNTSIESTTAITALNKGTYKLRVEDANGCSVDHPHSLTITTPSTALTSSYTLSDFNGYNIACAGANNAYATITAQGGNGGTYSGYEYALDNNFQSNSLIENISPGAHSLSVRDGRGCIVTNNITITEPANELEATLVDKEDVLCYGDESGLLSVSAAGGVTPYSFTLADITQTIGMFTNLSPGNYTITIRDKNGCTTAYEDEVLLLTTPINITSTVTPVLCHGGNDGAIDVSATGGDEPLTYQWNKNKGSSPDIQHLEAGEYILTAADQQGCSTQHSVIVPEPELLTLSIIPIPVCVGKTNGELHVNAEGGTGPFQYSIDNGFTFQTNTVFEDIAEGAHDILVKDSHSCIASASANITVRTDLPQPNFLVATKQNALDTLVVKEISIPKPDSIEWTFDAGINVLNENVWSPEITVEQEGIYTISLKGYFGGCDYTKTITLNISPYDPENHEGINLPVEVINNVLVNPNPNSGTFNVMVEMNTKQRVSMKVFDVLGVIHFSKNWDKTVSIEEDIDITESASSGIYIIQVVTDSDAREVRIMVNR